MRLKGFKFIGNLIIITFISCNSDEQSNPNLPSGPLPKVETLDVISNQNEKVIAGGRITLDSGEIILNKGLCWSENRMPTYLNDTTISKDKSNEFVSTMDSLKANTNYFYRAYAFNKNGIGYGEIKSFSTTEFVLDLDGNAYNTLEIGNRVWFKENLKTESYSNGDSINEKFFHSDWRSTSEGAFVANFMFTQIDAKNEYGLLYNYYAVEDQRNLCPSGWRVPNDDDWLDLFNALGGNLDSVGALLKEEGGEHWIEPNIASDSIGFSLRAGGYRTPNSANPNLPNGFQHFTLYAYLWSSSESTNDSRGRYKLFKNNSAAVQSFETDKRAGMSVRCVKEL